MSTTPAPERATTSHSSVPATAAASAGPTLGLTVLRAVLGRPPRPRPFTAGVGTGA